MRQHPLSRLLVEAARRAGRDPLEALDLHHRPFTPHLAALLLELTSPPKENGEHSETELDRMAEELKARMDRRDAWKKLEKHGYSGERGQHVPDTSPALITPGPPDSSPSPPALKAITPPSIPARKGRRWRR